MSVPRILIVNLTRLGDLLQTSPTVAALRARHPDARIVFLAEKNFAEACRGVPGLDRIISWDLDTLGERVLEGGHALLEAYRRVDDLVREVRDEGFDLALNFSSSRMSAVLMGLFQIPDVRGWTMTADGYRVIRGAWSQLFAATCLNRHTATFNLVDYYRWMAGGGWGPERLLYEVEEEGRRRARALLSEAGLDGERPLVALQTGASRESRQWPAESFAELARRLVAAGFRIAIVGGGADRERAAALVEAAGPGVASLCGRTDLQTLGALLERTRVLVTGDTGPMHMAAAVGTPVVALFFGPALPFDTGPYGRDHLLLHASVPCAPCEHMVRCLSPFCREEIRPELVDLAVRARAADDWDALGELGRASPWLSVFRTDFDEAGFHVCRRLGAGSSEREEIRSAYRALWVEELAGGRVGAGGGAPGCAEAFAGLAGLAEEGEALATELMRAAGAATPDVARAEQLGRALERVEAAVAAHGAVHAETAVLAQMHRFGTENLEGSDVVSLARETVALHRALGRRAQTMRDLLARRVQIGEEERCRSS